MGDQTQTETTRFPRIVAVALKFSEDRTDWISEGAPKRHHDLIRTLHGLGYSPKTIVGATQGFMTSDGRFVDRFEAMDIAILAEQVDGARLHGRELFSEDVW